MKCDIRIRFTPQGAHLMAISLLSLGWFREVEKDPSMLEGPKVDSFRATTFDLLSPFLDASYSLTTEDILQVMEDLTNYTLDQEESAEILLFVLTLLCYMLDRYEIKREQWVEDCLRLVTKLLNVDKSSSPTTKKEELNG